MRADAAVETTAAEHTPWCDQTHHDTEPCGTAPMTLGQGAEHEVTAFLTTRTDAGKAGACLVLLVPAVAIPIQAAASMLESLVELVRTVT
jgi:hypothetical protein